MTGGQGGTSGGTRARQDDQWAGLGGQRGRMSGGQLEGLDD